MRLLSAALLLTFGPITCTVMNIHRALHHSAALAGKKVLMAPLLVDSFSTAVFLLLDVMYPSA